VVCGINLGRWGRDLVPAQRLADLVTLLDEHAPVDRIRLASIEPWIVDRDFIDAFASAHRIAPHVHLPIQSGDDGVLRAMRRPYTVEWFVETVSRLIAARPGLSLGTDVIAGFPGESDAAFERTLAVIRDLPVTYVHAFGFSPRPGTPAASMPDQVPSAEIGRRVREVMRIGLGKRVDFARSLVGDVVHPVFALRQRRAGTLVGVAGRYITVVTEGPATLAGRLAAVRVEGFDEHGRVLGCLIEHG
jgi:threonylcarbamoyladenosine tRNA methylthiotransferase MtaB